MKESTAWMLAEALVDKVKSKDPVPPPPNIMVKKDNIDISYLYLVSQKYNNDYDTFDSAVICASCEEEAKNISMESFNEICWVDNKNKIEVFKIGIASPLVKKGVILASFNAG